MIFNPVMVKTGGKEIKEVRVKRSGYEVDWTITIGGVKQTLTGDENVFAYEEGQKIDVPMYKSAKVTVVNGQVLLELTGKAEDPDLGPG